MASLPIPKGAIEIKIAERDWGIERSYKTPKGTEVCTPAPFYSSLKSSFTKPTSTP